MSRSDPEPQGKHKRKIIGLYPECSGLDYQLALLEIQGSGPAVKFKILHACRYAYNDALKQLLSERSSVKPQGIKSIGELTFSPVQEWTEKIREIADRYAAGADSIHLIGTLCFWFCDKTTARKLTAGYKQLLKMSDPAVLARITGINTITDFYLADSGAGEWYRSLLSYSDWLHFSRLKKNIILVNIGPMTDCTYLPAGGDWKNIRSCLAGPGSGLLNQLAWRLYELPFDRDGARARLGKFSEKLFEYLKKRDDLSEQAAHSPAGTDPGGSAFVLSILRQALRWRIPEPDVLHTVSRYIAFRVHKTCQNLSGGDVQWLVLTGSASQNSLITELLRDYFQPLPLKLSSDYNLPEDFREAVAAALLANECIPESPAGINSLRRLTKPAITGRIYPAGKNSTEH